MECDQFAPIFRIDPGTLIKQQLHHVAVAPGGDPEKRRPAIVILPRDETAEGNVTGGILAE